jgi:hypothetical protein
MNGGLMNEGVSTKIVTLPNIFNCQIDFPARKEEHLRLKRFINCQTQAVPDSD